MGTRSVELRHEWGRQPLWDLDRDDDIHPEVLGLPASVLERLDAWARRWDATFAIDDPTHRRVEPFVIEELGRDGARLWRALLGLLPPADFTVTYVHEDVRYRTPDELPIEWRFG